MMLDCSHHYCRDCGRHNGFEHEPGCPTGEREEAQRKYWEEAAKRDAGEGHPRDGQ